MLSKLQTFQSNFYHSKFQFIPKSSSPHYIDKKASLATSKPTSETLSEQPDLKLPISLGSRQKKRATYEQKKNESASVLSRTVYVLSITADPERTVRFSKTATRLSGCSTRRVPPILPTHDRPRLGSAFARRRHLRRAAELARARG